MNFISNRSHFFYCYLCLLTLLSILYFFDNSYGSAQYAFNNKWHTSCDIVEGNWACDSLNNNADGLYRFPTGIAIDKDGNVYVADSWNDRIQKFSSDGTFITKWGSRGSGDGEFRFPTGIAIDKDGNVYVADFSNDRIQKFSSDGTFITKWGSSGSGDGEFLRPYYIGIDASSNSVYVSDFSNSRIQKFSSDGTFITKWGSRGYDDGQFGTGDGTFFTGPTGIAIDKDGNVYVADFSNDRIQKFSSDGTFITKWGSSGSGDGEFRFPTGIAIDKDGNVYVADSWNDRIQKFSSDGTFITQMGSIELNDNTRTFEEIFDLKIFNKTIIVSDSRTDSIEILSLVN
jgi:tripartite motif-containing protein 71